MVLKIPNPGDRIGKRFRLNMGRVGSLISLFKTLKGQKIDVTESQKGDLLRSAVVFLHASLEDLLREALRWKRPFDNAEFTSKLRFVSGNKPLKKSSLSPT
jgi:hypothetical protein